MKTSSLVSSAPCSLQYYQFYNSLRYFQVTTFSAYKALNFHINEKSVCRERKIRSCSKVDDITKIVFHVYYKIEIQSKKVYI